MTEAIPWRTRWCWWQGPRVWTGLTRTSPPSPSSSRSSSTPWTTPSRGWWTTPASPSGPGPPWPSPTRSWGPRTWTPPTPTSPSPSPPPTVGWSAWPPDLPIQSPSSPNTNWPISKFSSHIQVTEARKYSAAEVTLESIMSVSLKSNLRIKDLN